jgi:DNA polymerase-3 subunit gamma/tau
MSYLVLARKYRPGTFSEVVGQEHVTRTLKNAIRSDRLGHAFLFSGLRGVGKTSVARILAKTLNCEGDNTQDEPCGECPSCLEVNESRSLNVVEMDAASHTGVDDIRELRESVMYAPGEGKHKVYIIDEVHMLSKNAFNALLKTLEEPPPRVIFILATTEPHKVPVTIQSRCQRYDFRRIPSATMAQHLMNICRSEGVEISMDSLKRIAIAAEGSLRDSQSLLDQVLSFAGEKVKDGDVTVVLGTLDRGMLMDILDAALSGRSGDALQSLSEMIDNGSDPLRIAMDLIELLRALLLLTEMEEAGPILDLPEGEMELLQKIVAGKDADLMRIRFALLARGEERMRRSPQPRFHLELAIVHLARAEEVVSPGSGPVKKVQVDSTEEERRSEPKNTSPVEQATADETERKATADSSASPAFAAIETPEETWEQLVEFISDRVPSIGSILEHLVCVKIAGDELVVGGKKGEWYMEFLGEREKILELAKLVSDFFSRDMKVRLVELDAEERTGNSNILEKKESKESDLARKIRKETLEHHAIQGAIEIFHGEVESVRVLSGKTSDGMEINGKEEEA